jgi:hypothetical protein
MQTKSPLALVLAVLLSFLLTVPADIWAAPQAAAGQRAGEVSRVIPSVSIARGSKTITASSKSAVDWQDLVNTQVNARARIALDDGSVLNVGSESSMKIVKHDAGAQQTALELTYGKLRTQAQKIAKPDGKFEVRTPAGVAGVVGTDFFTGYDNSTGTMNVIVFEGLVKVCNLAGVCVLVKAGQMTSVRNGDNAGPTPPVQAPFDLLVATSKDTNAGLSGINPAGPHLGTLGTVAIVGAAVGVGLGIGLTRPGGTPAQRGCKPNPQTGLCP